MNPMAQFLTTIFIAPIIIGWMAVGEKWISERQKNYELHYTQTDKRNKREYLSIIKKGFSSVSLFFESHFQREFDIYIHPSRQSLDSTWQRDWKMPDFKSECWMVASGTALKLDMISPKIWDKVACEHNYAESAMTQRLITHELVHVFHGQANASPDFSNTEGIDWFVEGLATYASGQCDSSKIADVKKSIFANKVPKSLDNFWAGNLKYGLSGSLVMYIDKNCGRQKLKELLPFNKKSEILQALNITETELLTRWTNYVKEL
jgi:hypothetical protein